MNKTELANQEKTLSATWSWKFKDAMVAKAPYTRDWNTFWDAYRGDYFRNKNLPEYKSNMVSNYIFSIIETIRPIMLDNDPKFQAVPRQPEGMQFSGDLQEAMLYEWDREKMNRKLYRELITTLVTGTAVFFMPWNSGDKNVNSIPVNPFNVFPDPLATTVEDAEYIIYASYKNVSILRRTFPGKADKLTGGDVKYGELVNDNNKNARITNQVLVLEVWTRDYETEETLDSTNKVKTTKQKYPNGRVITIAPELGIVLSDKANPYQDGRFPFVLFKDYDVPGKFWGEGEISQLLSPQQHMNELNNAIIDNAKTTANMPWIVDKNAGIGYGKITSRPGLVIRKNPGSEVHREQPPNMPAYVVNAVETYKSDMEQISGIFDTLKGNSETGVYTAQGILALQEAGQARIRLKVKLMEDSLGDMATLWFSRMRQYWKDSRFIKLTRHDGSYDLKMFTKAALGHDYDIKITAGSTMPVNRGAMLDLMIRLAQTQMPDGQMLVDREAVAQYLPEEVKSAMIKRMQSTQGAIEQQLQQLTQAQQQLQQQLQQFAQQNQQDDSQTLSAIDEITKALDHLNKQILQVQDSNAKMVAEQKKQDEVKKIQDNFYNKGYGDAEKLLTSDQPQGENTTSMISDSSQIGSVQDKALPNDVLTGLENLSDDQLQLIIQQNPQLLQLIGQ